MTLNATAAIEAFIAALPLRSSALCSKLRLHSTDDFDQLWRRFEDEVGAASAMLPPYWAIAWPAGQALARYLLDNPTLVRGQAVLDLGTGSGICALAAALCGAKRVDACDADPNARIAVALNARANGCAIHSITPEPKDSGDWTVILAADIWYERFSSAVATAWLRCEARRGALVLLCDTGRAFFPRFGLRRVDRSAAPIRAPDGEMTIPTIYALDRARPFAEPSTSALHA